MSIKSIITLMTLAAAQAVSAQTSGKVTYNEKVKLEIRLDGIQDQALLNSIPKEKTSQGILSFTNEAALYEKIKKEENNDINQTTEDGGQVMIKMQEPDDKFFTDLKEKKKTEQRDFMGRMFLVESDMKGQNWKMTGKQKTILNYPCQEAVLQDTSKKVTAWFTSSIPVSAGPNGYANLPGMILEVSADSGRVTMTAAKVELGPIENSALVKPSKGKKVTKAEFDKVVAEKRKEMQEQYGGSGNMMIKIENR